MFPDKSQHKEEAQSVFSGNLRSIKGMCTSSSKLHLHMDSHMELEPSQSLMFEVMSLLLF